MQTYLYEIIGPNLYGGLEILRRSREIPMMSLNETKTTEKQMTRLQNSNQTQRLLAVQKRNWMSAVSSVCKAAVIGSLFFTLPALAQSNSRDGMSPTKLGGGVTKIDALEIREAIRDSWAQFTLMQNGDGVAQEGDKWVERSFTPDAVFKLYASDGYKLREYRGMKELKKYLGWVHPGQLPKQGAGKHLPLIIAFDEITPTTAKTRTVLLDFSIERSKVKGKADTASGSTAPGVPSKLGLAVYHDTWRLQDGLWRKSLSILYSANSGCFPYDSRIADCGKSGLHATNPPPYRPD